MKYENAEDGVRNLSGTAIDATFALDGVYLSSPVLETEPPVQRAGFMVDLDELKLRRSARLQARGFVDGEPGDWIDAEVTWLEDPLFVARADFGFDATAVQIRVHADDAPLIYNLSWAAVTVLTGEESISNSSSTTAAMTATGGETPGVVSRATWEARASECSTGDSVRDRITIHHTVTPTQAGGSYERRVRAVQAFHMDVQGWCDIGYHFLVTADGQAFEGRPSQYLGAHVAGANTGNLGVAFVGCFQEEGCNGWAPAEPPEEMLVGGVHLIEQLAIAHGITVEPATVLGHRDHPGADTACPGANLHADLQGIRNEVNMLLEDPGQEQPAADDPGQEQLAAEDPCGGVTYTGECDGNTLRWCYDNEVHEYNCTIGGWACQWQDESAGYACIQPATPCGGIDYFGTCEGGLLSWCQDEILYAFDCGASGHTCAWQDDSIGYNCL